MNANDHDSRLEEAAALRAGRPRRRAGRRLQRAPRRLRTLPGGAALAGARDPGAARGGRAADAAAGAEAAADGGGPRRRRRRGAGEPRRRAPRAQPARGELRRVAARPPPRRAHLQTAGRGRGPGADRRRGRRLRGRHRRRRRSAARPRPIQRRSRTGSTPRWSPKDLCLICLTNVKQLPKGKVLEAWVQRGNAVEPVPALFAPDHAGNASTTIENVKNVSLVMGPGSPRAAPRSRPRNGSSKWPLRELSGRPNPQLSGRSGRC